MFLRSLAKPALTACLGLFASNSLLAQAIKLPPADYRSMKYGLFVHYVWGGEGYKVTIRPDGSMPASLDDLANRFNAERFANDVASMGVEYVLFTAWHANMNLLYPSKAMEKWMPGHSAKRDLIGDMIKACKAKGVKVLLYTHPRDGHDFMAPDQARTGWAESGSSNPDWAKFDKEKWNNFINDIYGELADRYGNDLLGLYLDEGSGAADSYKVVDYPRLRKTITSRHPHLLMMQNDYGNLYTADLGNQEVFYGNSFSTPDGDQWKSHKIPISIVTGSIFWAAFAEGKDTPAQPSPKVGFNKWIQYTPESLYRYTVFQAGSNTDGGGVVWAAGPYADGGWETGVLERLQKTGALIKPIEKSLKNTFASTSWPTPAGSTIASISWGVATRSTDDALEFIHVLKAPADGSKSLKLPPPADGKRFSAAALLPAGTPVALTQSTEGVTLTLPADAAWSPLHTAIQLTVAADSPPSNLAIYKTWRTSSHSGNPHHPSMATDGSESTQWTSAPEDPSPWAWLDLSRPANISRIEISGNPMPGDSLKISETMDFSKVAALATFTGKSPSLVVIRKATYGKGSSSADVTAKLQALATSGSLTTKAENALCGSDPAPSQPKELVVEYTLNGQFKSQSVSEGDTLTIGEPSKPWTINPPAGTTARFIRLERKATKSPLSVNEIRVIGKFK